MRVLRWHEVQTLVRLSRSTVWRLENDGAFPRRRRLSANSVGWIEQEVHEWIRRRSAVGHPSNAGGR